MDYAYSRSRGPPDPRERERERYGPSGSVGRLPRRSSFDEERYNRRPSASTASPAYYSGPSGNSKYSPGPYDGPVSRDRERDRDRDLLPARGRDRDRYSARTERDREPRDRDGYFSGSFSSSSNSAPGGYPAESSYSSAHAPLNGPSPSKWRGSAQSLHGSPDRHRSYAQNSGFYNGNGRPRSLSPPYYGPRSRYDRQSPPYDDATRRPPLRERDREYDRRDRDFDRDWERDRDREYSRSTGPPIPARSREPSWTERKPLAKSQISYENPRLPYDDYPGTQSGASPAVTGKRPRDRSDDGYGFERRSAGPGWQNAPRVNGESNGWKGKGGPYEDDDRRLLHRISADTGFSSNNAYGKAGRQRTSSRTSASGFRGRSPSVAGSEVALHSPSSAADTSSRLSDRLQVEQDRTNTSGSQQAGRRSSLSLDQHDLQLEPLRDPDHNDSTGPSYRRPDIYERRSASPISNAKPKVYESRARANSVALTDTPSKPLSLQDRLGPPPSATNPLLASQPAFEKRPTPPSKASRVSMSPPTSKQSGPGNTASADDKRLEPTTSQPPSLTQQPASQTAPQADTDSTTPDSFPIDPPTSTIPPTHIRKASNVEDIQITNENADQPKDVAQAECEADKPPKKLSSATNSPSIETPPNSLPSRPQLASISSISSEFNMSKSSNPVTDQVQRTSLPLKALKPSLSADALGDTRIPSVITTEIVLTSKEDTGRTEAVVKHVDQSQALTPPAIVTALEDVDSERPDVADGEDRGREDEAFAKVLTSFIEDEDHIGEDDSMDIDAVLAANRFKTPVALPVEIVRREKLVDEHSTKIALDIHELVAPSLLQYMQDRDERRGFKIVRLRNQYKEIDDEWQIHCAKLEKIRSRQKKRQNVPVAPLTPAIDAQGLPIAPIPSTPSIIGTSSRTNRRSAASSLGYGDAARSEAEFLEILASLEDADMRDPNLRAMRTTATVPDMALDEEEKARLAYDDNNGLVLDPFEHYGLNKKPDVWSEQEIATFCRRYALYPKQFGKIASALPDKSTRQCVLFYYRSKKKINFRALVDSKSKDGKRKRSRKTGDKGGDVSASGGSQKKGSSLLANLKRAKGDEEEEEDDDDQPQTPGSAMVSDATILPAAKALLNGLLKEQEDRGRWSTTERNTNEATRPSISRNGTGTSRKAARFLSPPQTDTYSTNTPDEGTAPPSDSALAAAEALNVLAGFASESNTSSRLSGKSQSKKRKPSLGEPSLESTYGEDGTPKAGGVPSKRIKSHSSSYWSVADKTEFVRLLGLHGKNYQAIANGIESKTAVQCKNFYQNNVKKLGLSDIASRAEGDLRHLLDADSVRINTNGDMPSVFINPNNPDTPTSKPATGFFTPTVTAERDHIQERRPSTGGGMHLRNLLDDAPDAEGGARHHYDEVSEDVKPAAEFGPGDEDSATEEETEPERYAAVRAFDGRKSDLDGDYKRDLRDTQPGYSNQAPASYGRDENRMVSGVSARSVHEGSSYKTASVGRGYVDSQHSPVFSTSATFPSVLGHNRPSESHPHYSGRPSSASDRYMPPSATWSPYDPDKSHTRGYSSQLDYYASQRQSSQSSYEGLPPVGRYYPKSHTSVPVHHHSHQSYPEQVNKTHSPTYPEHGHSPYYDPGYARSQPVHTHHSPPPSSHYEHYPPSAAR